MTEARKNKFIEVLNRRQQNLTVVLENVHDPHNAFAIMRTCDAVGIQDIHIINTKFPKHVKAGHSSGRSAKKWVTIYQYETVEACMEVIKKNFAKLYTTHLSEDALDMYEIDFTQSVALAFGNEQSGISDELKKYADGNFIIPQMGMIKSLNISVACAVTLYEALRQKRNANHYTLSSLPIEKYNSLMTEWCAVYEQKE